MVREYEREERDVVWFILDASVELGAGNPGYTPLDRAIDEVSGYVTRHAARALGLTDVGALVPEARGDCVIWNCDRPVDVCYRMGDSLVDRVIAAGTPI